MESTEKKPVYDLHRENQEWISKLSFYEDEIKILKHRIEEVAKANNKIDIMAMVEHFQNQFIIQKDAIDTFKHEIRLAEQGIVDLIDKNPIAADKKRMDDHSEIRDKFATFESLFHSMKDELMSFVGKVL